MCLGSQDDTLCVKKLLYLQSFVNTYRNYLSKEDENDRLTYNLFYYFFYSFFSLCFKSLQIFIYFSYLFFIQIFIIFCKIDSLMYIMYIN